ncbi:hypothetical protein HOH87_04525 [bacterium]|jgi:NTP pyrophosphatase (non-canonical NTP hydrolase)|nr:hypothetical protein [bacterium]
MGNLPPMTNHNVASSLIRGANDVTSSIKADGDTAELSSKTREAIATLANRCLHTDDPAKAMETAINQLSNELPRPAMDEIKTILTQSIQHARPTDVLESLADVFDDLALSDNTPAELKDQLKALADSSIKTAKTLKKNAPDTRSPKQIENAKQTLTELMKEEAGELAKLLNKGTGIQSKEDTSNLKFALGVFIMSLLLVALTGLTGGASLPALAAIASSSTSATIVGGGTVSTGLYNFMNKMN